LKESSNADWKEQKSLCPLNLAYGLLGLAAVALGQEIKSPHRRSKHQADIYSNAVSSQPGTSSSIEARIWDAEMLLKTVADKDVLILTPATCTGSTPESHCWRPP